MFPVAAIGSENTSIRAIRRVADRAADQNVQDNARENRRGPPVADCHVAGCAAGKVHLAAVRTGSDRAAGINYVGYVELAGDTNRLTADGFALVRG
jgi:hypothetical protein